MPVSPSSKPATNMILAALKLRFAARGLSTYFTDIAFDEVNPRQTRPYLVITSVIEETRTRTNVSAHQRVNFMASVVTDTIENVGELTARVKSAIEDEALHLEGGALRNLVPPQIQFFREEQLHKGQLNYEATVVIPRISPRSAAVK